MTQTKASPVEAIYDLLQRMKNDSGNLWKLIEEMRDREHKDDRLICSLITSWNNIDDAINDALCDFNEAESEEEK
ncbi:hypothetical protein V0288_22410 [Pannus brasiliensis CCIBt3594]|uniref:Uncharacterized protein n=1 Tax=Pannus brasiliensis CCIBt3594 TaxID=1427578 RepID=A0AAW9QZF9_9CHRO